MDIGLPHKTVLLLLRKDLQFWKTMTWENSSSLKNTSNLKVIQKIKLIIFPGSLLSLLPNLMLCGKCFYLFLSSDTSVAMLSHHVYLS